MKQILMFARDPGEANALIPVYQRMKGKFNLLVYGKEFSLHSFKANDVPAEDIQKECVNITEEEIYKFLKQKRPNFVLTGTSYLGDYTERYLWKASKALGIKSAVILDQWMQMGMRFSPYGPKEREQYFKNRLHLYLPDRILVMNTLAEEILRQEGIPKELICVTGQPHFDTVLKRYENALQPTIHTGYHICYVSEPIYENYDNGRSESYWGYNEKTNFYSLYKCLERLTELLRIQVELVIRPHPRESTAEWEQIIRKFHSKWIKLYMDKKSDSFTLMKKMDLICGMSSMFLLEAVICGKPIISIQIGLKRENPFVLSIIGSCQTQLTEEELENSLKNVMTGKWEQIKFPFINNATERVSSYIEKEMQSDEHISD